MAHRVFRSMRLICCDTCSQEWFGSGGEQVARDHAIETGHQVRIEMLVRETINAVSEAYEPSEAEQVSLSPADLKRSRSAAVARLTEDGVL